MASSEFKRIVATLFAQGYSNQDIAQMHNKGRNTISRMRTDPECMEMVGQFQKELTERTIQSMFQYMEKQPALAARMISMALDPEHPKAFDANKWIQERILPERKINSGSVDVNVNIQAETLLAIQTTLTKITEMRDPNAKGGVVDVTASPHLRDGREAIPHREKSAEDGGPPPEWDPDAVRRNNPPVSEKAPLRLQQHGGAQSTVKTNRVDDSAQGQ